MATAGGAIGTLEKISLPRFGHSAKVNFFPLNRSFDALMVILSIIFLMIFCSFDLVLPIVCRFDKSFANMAILNHGEQGEGIVVMFVMYKRSS